MCVSHMLRSYCAHSFTDIICSLRVHFASNALRKSNPADHVEYVRVVYYFYSDALIADAHCIIMASSRQDYFSERHSG